MNIAIIISLIVLVILLIILFKKVPILKPLIATVVCITIIGGAVYSGLELNRYYQTKGGIFGAISGNFDTNQVAVNDLNFSLTNIELKQEEGATYSANTSINEKFELKENTKYGMFLNDTLCFDVTNNTDFITAKYTHNFYDSNKNLLLTDTLSFNFAFYTNYAYLYFKTDGGSNAVKFWHSYFQKNNAVVSIKPATYIPNENLEYGEGQIPEVCFLTLDVDGETTQSLVSKGSILSLANLYTPEKQYYRFTGWYINDEQITAESQIVVNEDVTVTARFEEMYRWVMLDRGVETVAWHRVGSGETRQVTLGSEYPLYNSLKISKFAKMRLTLSYLVLWVTDNIGSVGLDENFNTVESSKQNTEAEFVLEEGQSITLHIDEFKPYQIVYEPCDITIRFDEYNAEEYSLYLTYECPNNTYELDLSAIQVEIYEQKF